MVLVDHGNGGWKYMRDNGVKKAIQKAYLVDFGKLLVVDLRQHVQDRLLEHVVAVAHAALDSNNEQDAKHNRQQVPI